ncbi:hypothetical protein MesoLjLb_53720 [Mesorhizobium sp. L-8-3]|nr:hypothetical protein MesoLjLb_53720 [Mesorhizobium sp. L-8-3]
MPRFADGHTPFGQMLGEEAREYIAKGLGAFFREKGGVAHVHEGLAIRSGRGASGVVSELRRETHASGAGKKDKSFRTRPGSSPRASCWRFHWRLYLVAASDPQQLEKEIAAKRGAAVRAA